MAGLKEWAEQWLMTTFLCLAVLGCFTAMALLPDKAYYPDLSLPSKDLVALEAQYVDRVELVNRGEFVERSASQLLIRNQDGNLVYVPYSDHTELQGVASLELISPGAFIAVTRPAGAAPASRIRVLD